MLRSLEARGGEVGGSIVEVVDAVFDKCRFF
jgi:hypothetical protein